MTRKEAFWMVRFTAHMLMALRLFYDTSGVITQRLCINTIACHYSKQWLIIPG